MPQCIYIAAKMLGIEALNMTETHPDLYDRLNQVNGLCRQTGGELRSRQVIAVIVNDWQVIQNLGGG